MTPENDILHFTLRVLVPEEINDLTDEFVAFNKVTLTSLLNAEFGFENEEVSEVQEVTVEAKIEAQKIIDEELPDNTEEAISSFILAQREKLKQSNYKLREKGIHGLYKDNAKVDVEQEKALKKNKVDERVGDDKNEKPSTIKSGILVNKNHY